MSHFVETMAWTDEKPWHGLGVEFEGNLTVEQMVKKAGIDWEVSLRPIAFNPEQSIQDGFDGNGLIRATRSFRALVRESDGKLLDIVGSRYQPTQNLEAFRFFEEFVQAGSARLKTAGSLRGGNITWCLASLEDSFTLAGGDKVEGYILLTNPHEQGKSIVGKFTSVCVVCWNTLTEALRGTGDEIRHSHRRVFDAVMREGAKRTLGIAREQLDKHKEEATSLSRAKVTRTDALRFLGEVVDPQLWSEVGKSAANLQERLDANKAGKKLTLCVQSLDKSPGAQLKSRKDTLWGIVNAISYSVDHQFGRGEDQRLTRAWFGAGASLKSRAMKKALQLVG